MNAANDIFKKHRLLLHEQAQSLLQKRIDQHQTGKCACDETAGLCYAGQFLDGKISSMQVIEDLSRDIKKTAIKATWKKIFADEQSKFMKKQFANLTN